MNAMATFSKPMLAYHGVNRVSVVAVRVIGSTTQYLIITAKGESDWFERRRLRFIDGTPAN